MSTPTDDSPFVAPPDLPSRPTLNQFQGAGSVSASLIIIIRDLLLILFFFYSKMRAGTQTLIQALQALPWGDDENDDDMSNHDSSEDEDRPRDRKRVSSFI
jgi:sterol 3beta-glucosyltransferase